MKYDMEVKRKAKHEVKRNEKVIDLGDATRMTKGFNFDFVVDPQTFDKRFNNN